MERLGIDYEIVDYVEIDKYAVKSFNAIHDSDFEPQDICEWDKDIECDLIMHGSPCQDFSLAGKQAGGDEGSGTRSSLMYETIRIVEKLRPKYVIWENVKNVISKKHKHNFDNYIDRMTELGYTSYYQVLNAKDYGIPQNRERVFTVSILDDTKYTFPQGRKCNNKVISYNNDAKHQQDLVQDEEGICRCIPAGTHGSTPHLLKTIVRKYTFPPKQELKLKLKDMLEDNVDEKYYLSDEMINYISATGTANFKNHDSKINLDIARPLTTDPNKRAGTTNYLSKDLPANYDLEPINAIKYENNTICETRYDEGIRTFKDNLCGSLRTIDACGNKCVIQVKKATKQGFLEATAGDGIDISSRMKYHRGNVQKDMVQTITTAGGNERGVVVKDFDIDLSCLD